MSIKLTRVIVIDKDNCSRESAEVTASKVKTEEASLCLYALYDTVADAESKALVKTLTKAAEEAGAKLNVIEKKDASRKACYNDALSNCETELISLTRLGSCPASGSFSAAVKEFENKEINLVSYWPFQEMEGKRLNQIYFSGFDKVYDTYENPFHISLVLDGFIFRSSSVGDIRIDEKAFNGEQLFLIKVYDKLRNYKILSEKIFVRDYLMVDFYNYRPMYDKAYYTQEVRNVFIPILKGEDASGSKASKTSPVVQAGILELIQFRIGQNANDRNKNVILGEEIDEFYASLRDAFQFIDDEILSQYKWTHRRTVPRFMSIKFLRLKYNDMSLCGTPVKSKDGKTWLAECKGTIIESFEKAVVNLSFINYEKGNEKNGKGSSLVMEGELANVYYADFDTLKLRVCFGKEKREIERTAIYFNIRHFGRTTKKGYTFKATVPADKLKANDRIFFEYEYEGATVRLPITFLSFQSRLSNKLPESYWIFGDRILSYNEKKKEMPVEKKTGFKHFKRELKMMYRVMRHGHSRIGDKKSLEMVRIRAAVKLSRLGHGKGKKIWITYDQLFKGGDNGQYFYEYMNKNVSDIDTYYIINKDTPEYKKLSKKYKTLLPFGSHRTRVMAMKADMIFATRIDIKLYMGYTEEDEIYVRDLFKADSVCLQHGLTIQKIAQYQNKLYDNTKHYFCVSPKEVENITKPIYGYTEDMITLTGAPRYDGLVGEPKKQILITPTWRRNVTAGTNEKGKQHNYSVNFKRTAYYRIYNTVINDKRLIEAAKKNGYKIIYLVHPILSPQAGDYDKNDFVEIVKGTEANYEKMLKESALMVTDYSGIQFDFAYMRRPLVYFHPAELPPQYDEADTGFGPVCRTGDELVDELVKAMETGCRLTPERKEIVDSFFPYDDQNACERVYEAARKL